MIFLVFSIAVIHGAYVDNLPYWPKLVERYQHDVKINEVIKAISLINDSDDLNEYKSLILANNKEYANFLRELNDLKEISPWENEKSEKIFSGYLEKTLELQNVKILQRKVLFLEQLDSKIDLEDALILLDYGRFDLFLIKEIRERSSLSWVEAIEHFSEMLEGERKKIISQIIDLTIIIPEDGRGGYGDLVSNLWMARLFQNSQIFKKVTLVVPPSFNSKLENLFLYYHSYKNSQEIEGFNLVKKEELGVTPQCLVSFSSSAPGLGNFQYTYFKKFFLPIIKFGEYDSLLDLEDGASPDTVDDIFYVPTGITGVGLYLSSRKIRFYKEVSGSYGNRLSFAYTHEGEDQEIFLNSLNIYAIENPQLKIHIFSNAKKSALPKFSENINFQNYNSISLENSEKYITLSNLPILVTGDMSATLAIQNEKPFFYQDLKHKQNFFLALGNFIKRRIPSFTRNTLRARSNNPSWYFEIKNYESFKKVLKELKEENTFLLKSYGSIWNIDSLTR